MPERKGVNYSVRVDRIGRRVMIWRFIRGAVAVLVALIMLIPVGWMGLTAF